MSTAIVSLTDLVLYPEKPVDLLAMSEAEAIAEIKKSFGFLSSAIEVSIREGIAYITFPDAESKRVDDALKSIERAENHAKHGEYKRAIQLFQRALEVIPNHTRARRNLAMAYLESGDKEKAKGLLIQVLALDPKDEWAFVLIGNIYSKHEKNLDQAERFYRRAFELDPRDAILLTNYGALMIERGNREQAAEFFERAIEAHPTYPNSYYALALLNLQDGKPDKSLALLDDMFIKAEPGDVRSSPLYAESRRMYLDVSRQIADQSYDRFMEFVQQKKSELESREDGYPIEFVEDNSLKVSAVSQIAWKHKRDKHLVRYRNKARAITPHLLAHELEHLSLEYSARDAGRNRFFSTTAKSREYAIKSIRDDILKLQHQGYPENQIQEVVLKLVGGLANQLFNTPLDMLIEHRLHQDGALIRPSQFVSLYAINGEGLESFTKSEIKRLTPPRIWKISVTLNCALALFYDSLYGGRTDYARPYRSENFFSTAQKLFGLWQDMMRDYKHGDEYSLVDEFARVLKLENWFEWVTDFGVSVDESSPFIPYREESSQGPTNPELLKQKEPATLMYMLGVLERFDKLSQEEIRAIGFEIGIRGMEGIDYASSDKEYTLKAFPGEKFSGLQMLCFMYAAFQVIDPKLNTGLDFKDVYQMALKMFKPGAS